MCACICLWFQAPKHACLHAQRDHAHIHPYMHSYITPAIQRVMHTYTESYARTYLHTQSVPRVKTDRRVAMQICSHTCQTHTYINASRSASGLPVNRSAGRPRGRSVTKSSDRQSGSNMKACLHTCSRGCTHTDITSRCPTAAPTHIQTDRHPYTQPYIH